MAVEVGAAYLTIVPSMKGFGKKLSGQIDPEMGTAGKSAGSKFGSALAASGKKSGLSFSKVLGGVLLGGAGVAIAGIGAIIHTGFGEVMDASAGTAQLAAGIKSTGNAAGVSVKGLNDLASSIEGYSGQTDDSIVASEKLLLTFTNIKNNGPDKIFDLATAATANMAAKLGGDASEAAIQLGKALNDPVKGVSALSRVGVSFTEGQKKSIKAMVEHGDQAGAQKIILKELETEFGGAAKAFGDSGPGQIAKSKRAFEGLSQTLVEGAMPAIGKISDKIKTDVIPAMKNFATEFTNGTGAGGTFKNVLNDVGAVIGTTATAIGGIVGWLKDHNGVVKAAAVVVGVLTVAVQAHNLALAISTGSLKAWILQTTIVKTGLAVWTAGQWLLTAAMNANPIGLVITAIGLLIGGIVLIATKTTWFQTVWKVMTDALGAAWRWMWNSILAPIIRFVLNGFASITDGIAGMLHTLSNIPGFGWAKTAADKMAGAADKARALAKGIKDIPDKKTIDITARFTSVVANATATAAHNLGARAAFAGGTNFAPGGPALVGENGPEVVYLPRGSQVIPNHAIGSAMAGGGIDYDRLGEAVAKAVAKRPNVLDGQIMAASVDRRLGSYR